MTQITMASRKRWTTAMAACFVTLAAAGGTMASGASADSGDSGTRVVTGGSLSWGVKASFRTYMVGPIASGSITPADGATVDSAKVATFTGGNGAVTGDGEAHVSYKGSVHYYGHDGELDFTLSNPYIMMNKAGTGSLYVNYAVAQGASKTVKIADLSGTGPVVSGDLATVSDASAKLTEAGVEVFSYKGHGFYEVGTQLDAVNAKADLAPVSTTTPTDPSTTTPTDPGTTTPTDPGTTTPTDPGTTTPTDPGTTAPTDPGTTAPTNPGTTTPTDPGTTAPTDPGTTAPTNPGTTTPTDPGTTTPTNPGTTTPTDPGTTTPTTPAKPALSITTAGKKQVGQTTYAWGKLSGAKNPQKVCTQFLVAPGRWSQSQCATTEADGSYAIPLTYGATTPGTYSVRVVSGSTTSSEATLTRVAGPKLGINTAGKKKVGQTTYAWGTLSGASNPTKVCTQFLVNGRWSQSQCAMTSKDGYYAIPLTYGATTPRTYAVRTVAGSATSAVASLTRTR